MLMQISESSASKEGVDFTYTSTNGIVRLNLL